MAYEIESGERIAGAARRIVAEEVVCAAAELARVGDGDRERSAVHEARKHCKKIRALLRLLRGPLGDRWHAEEAVVRDAARAVAELREREANVEAISALIDKERDGRTRERLISARKTFFAQRNDVMGDPARVSAAVEASRAHLQTARARLAEWCQLVPNGFDAVADGFRWSYSRARKAMKAALREPTDENYHTWRTWVKYHGCQLRLLQPRRASKLSKHLKKLDSLSDRLGFDHDLAMLGQAVTGWPSRFGGESEVEVIAELIARRRRKTQKKAANAGRRVFDEKPGRLTRRLKKHWEKRFASAPGPVAVIEGSPV